MTELCLLAFALNLFILFKHPCLDRALLPLIRSHRAKAPNKGDKYNTPQQDSLL